MPSTSKVTWRGKSVNESVNRAIENGLKETVEESVRTAKQLAPVDTGALREDIQVIQNPQRSGSRITARWGNTSKIFYAKFQEFGTIYIAPRYYLRRAMDIEYKKTNERIKKWMSH